jgi:hypothetical protein
MREFWKSMVIDIGGPPAAKPYERSEPGEYDRPEKGENSIFGEPHPIMSISTVQDVEAVDNTPKPVASEAAAKTSADIIGFWESISFNKSGMSLTGWAVRKPSGEAPVSFSIPWGDGEENVAPNLIRADVTKMLGRGDDRCGISITAPLPSDITADWTALADRSITATWADGSTYKLPRIRQFPSIELECLKFTTFEEFQKYFQNPAFRIKNPVLQANGAARAIRLAGDNRSFWLAAAIVALYRCFEDDVFPRDAAEALIQKWRVMAPELDFFATGELLRWATSMHLAAGYAHLAWGEYDKARLEFTAIPSYADRIKTWPQAVTNIGIGMFIGAWLEWRGGNIEAAKAALASSDTMFQTGVSVLKIWNWHMYEELRGALGTSQLCFSLLKRLENEPRAHVMPPTVVLKLTQISHVMRKLIERGLVANEPLPVGHVPE